MIRGTLAAIAAVAVIALSVIGAALARGTAPVTTLNGTVGPGFTIGLTQAGKRVTGLKAGTYRIVVADRSPEHDFALAGPGFRRALTDVGFTGTRTVTVKLTNGRWKFYCEPHSSEMAGVVTVGAKTVTATGATPATTTTTDDHGDHSELAHE